MAGKAYLCPGLIYKGTVCPPSASVNGDEENSEPPNVPHVSR